MAAHNGPMPRPSQLIHPQREPAPVRPAATVLLLRDSPQGVEVLMTRRSLTASFAPGAYVFPGGGIDAADAQAHGQATRRPTQSDLHLTQAIAAIRESFEELGVPVNRDSFDVVDLQPMPAEQLIQRCQGVVAKMFVVDRIELDIIQQIL